MTCKKVALFLLLKYFCLCQKVAANGKGKFKIKIVVFYNCPKCCFQIMLNSSIQGCQVFSTTWRGQSWACQLLPWPEACGTHDLVWSGWQPSIAHSSTEININLKLIILFFTCVSSHMPGVTLTGLSTLCWRLKKC